MSDELTPKCSRCGAPVEEWTEDNVEDPYGRQFQITYQKYRPAPDIDIKSLDPKAKRILYENLQELYIGEPSPAPDVEAVYIRIPGRELSVSRDQFGDLEPLWNEMQSVIRAHLEGE